MVAPHGINSYRDIHRAILAMLAIKKFKKGANRDKPNLRDLKTGNALYRV
jgi:hypothetical protein